MISLLGTIASGYRSTTIPPIVTDGLIFNIDANDINSYPGSGATVYDTANNKNGTLTNGCSFVSSGGAKYFNFDGLDDFIEFGSITSSDPVSLYGLSNMTIEFWMRNPLSATQDTYARLIDKSTGGNGADGWAFYVAGSTRQPIMAVVVDGTATPAFDNSAYSANTWYQFVITRTSSAWRLYVNTSYRSILYYSTSFPPDTANMRIGTWNHSTGRELQGDVGIVRLYNKVLSAVEIQTNFDARKNIYGI